MPSTHYTRDRYRLDRSRSERLRWTRPMVSQLRRPMLSKKICAVLALCMQCTPVASQDSIFLSETDFALATLKKNVEFDIHIVDSVSHGCWIDAQRSRAAVTRQLIDSGFTRAELGNEYPLAATYFVEALGFAVGASCAVHVKTVVSMPDIFSRYYDNERVSQFDWRSIHEGGTLLSGPISSMSSRVHETIMTQLDEFLIEFAKAKSDLSDEVSNLQDIPDSVILELQALSYE